MFVISTTGQGDMPHNSLLFWRKLLRKRLPPGCLSEMNYTCFGLGDSTYVKWVELTPSCREPADTRCTA